MFISYYIYDINDKIVIGDNMNNINKITMEMVPIFTYKGISNHSYVGHWINNTSSF